MSNSINIQKLGEKKLWLPLLDVEVRNIWIKYYVCGGVGWGCGVWGVVRVVGGCGGGLGVGGLDWK